MDLTLASLNFLKRHCQANALTTVLVHSKRRMGQANALTGETDTQTLCRTYTCEVTATGTIFTGNTSVARSYTVKTAASSNIMADNSTLILFTDNGGKYTAGNSVTLRCGAVGYPTPIYEWYDTKGNKLAQSDSYEQVFLRFPPPQQSTESWFPNEYLEVREDDTKLIAKSLSSSEDEAEYQCKATSGNSKFVEAIRLVLADIEPAFNSTMDNSLYDIPGATVKIIFSLSQKGQLIDYALPSHTVIS
eukprot:sb/3468844/